MHEPWYHTTINPAVAGRGAPKGYVAPAPTEIMEQTQLPALRPDVDRAAVRRMRLVARLLDGAVELPVVGRVGLDPLVGLLPVAGDAVTAAASLYVVAEAARQGVRPEVLAQMLANVAVDAAAGSVPVAGDLFDAVWRANERNVELAVADLAAEDGRRN